MVSRTLGFWVPQDSFIKPLISRIGGIADLPNIKDETELRQNKTTEEYVSNKRKKDTRKRVK